MHRLMTSLCNFCEPYWLGDCVNINVAPNCRENIYCSTLIMYNINNFDNIFVFLALVTPMS